MQCANVPTWELNRYRRQRQWTTDDVILQAIKDVCMEPPPDAHLGCFGGKKNRGSFLSRHRGQKHPHKKSSIS